MRSFVIGVLLVSSLHVCAQDSLFRTMVPRYALKFSPNHLIAFYPTVQLAYEARIASRYAIQVEGGYVLNYNETSDYQNKRGFKSKVEFHYYFLPGRRARSTFYSALELYYNSVDFDRDNSQQECYDLECNHMYIRPFRYKVLYREPGVAFKFGFVKYFNRFFIDVNSGWAIRFIDYDDPYADAPNQFVDDVLAWDFTPIEEDRVGFRPVVGFRVGYRVR